MKQERKRNSFSHNAEYLQQVSEGETAVILSELSGVLSSGVSGDVVEFGCYRGDTSLLMQKVLQREFPNSISKLWIYDSFEGLPARTSEDASVAGDAFRAGELLVTKREVVERFKKAGLKVPRIRKGFFEDLDSGDFARRDFDINGMELSRSEMELATSDLPGEIAFAFLDGDLYKSIKTSLELVTPRMNKNGVILVHDYHNPQLPGVSRAVDEWMARFGSAQKTAPKLQRRETLAIITW